MHINTCTIILVVYETTGRFRYRSKKHVDRNA